MDLNPIPYIFRGRGFQLRGVNVNLKHFSFIYQVIERGGRRRNVPLVPEGVPPPSVLVKIKISSLGSKNCILRPSIF